MGAQRQSGLVSVVIAAYNSSARLTCAVRSALNQTHGELEVIVVGDAVTDDSELRLTELGEARIRWENLPTNWGEQSVPSNRGIELARGEYVFFLNQDDLWLPDHVAGSLAELNDRKADVVCSPYLVAGPGSRPGDRGTGIGSRLDGISGRHPEFDPLTFVPASSTAWRMRAIDVVGGWRTAGEVTVSPSQDLLFRAFRAGLCIRAKDDPTVIVLWSGQRRGAFTEGSGAGDNAAWLEAILEEPEVVRSDIAAAGVAAAASARSRAGLVRRAGAIPGRAVGAIQQRMGIHPATLGVRRRYWRAGGFVNAARAGAGLSRRDFGVPVTETDP